MWTPGTRTRFTITATPEEVARLAGVDDPTDDNQQPGEDSGHAILSCSAGDPLPGARVATLALHTDITFATPAGVFSLWPTNGDDSIPQEWRVVEVLEA